MKLYHNPASPYTRKVMVVAHETGLADSIELMPITVWEEADRLRVDNPLGKIPALVLDDGSCLFDSPVICAYLDTLHNGPRMIPQGEDRWAVERLHALAQGMTDAALSLRADVMREQQADWYSNRMRDTVNSALAEAEKQLPSFADAVNLGTCALAAGLGYLDFRFPDWGWRDAHPGLANWFTVFSARPSMQATPTPEPA